MTDLNPVDAMTTPPEKLFAKWEDDILNERENVDVVLDCAWKNGFVAGANQELESCCEWLDRRLFGRDEIAWRPSMTDLNPVDAMTTDYRAMCAELTTALEYAWDGRRPKVVQELIDRARALLAQPVAEGPTIPSSKLHRQELTPLEITLLIEALDFAIGDIKARPNSSNHVAVRAKLKRSISRPKATND
jgi:hypothetical protein